MTEQEKMEELVDVLEMDLGEFDRDTVLEEVETWDSVADGRKIRHFYRKNLIRFFMRQKSLYVRR